MVDSVISVLPVVGSASGLRQQSFLGLDEQLPTTVHLMSEYVSALLALADHRVDR
jgi:hypothetical protein